MSKEGDYITPKHEDFDHDVQPDMEARVRQGVKAVLEEVLQEEMTRHLEAGYRELTPTRRGERNDHHQRNLVTPAGKIERLVVPRDREGEFVIEVFERYRRMTGDVEVAILEMYLSGISVRKIAGVTDGLSKVRVGKDAVSRIVRRLEEEPEGVAGAHFGGDGISLPCRRRFTACSSSAFSRRCLTGEVIAVATRWYVSYRLS